MRVLVIDTALNLCTVGVVEVVDGAVRPLGLRSLEMAKGHQERLAGLARDAVGETDGGFGAIDRIGVTVGPGSFTGLRVGLAFAHGLGAALDRPVVGLSTLDALAASADGAATDSVGALIDARRGQVYARFWSDGVPTGPAEALALEAAAARVEALAPGARLIGSGAALVAANRPDIETIEAVGPAPEALARLTAAADLAAGPAQPLYLRAPDATPPTRLPGQARPTRIPGA
ncbi:tRNA (adenosine(37)-N6)-threonylcarbamoyltransferase complex dimerization subunit type 1 TsaB [Brevundimonas sp. Root1279]|uniref:tRNA (adenosine(37)-N6)-threonylcarbamoyltransferase complex dimerization subunit type 1 TsaB n=1 Tax=Brevundimonas sp. Root1279 TaxID=1736443 RepID=UPI0006F34CCF|nr:tRNA (adenosine(37)-N6)-threonylcarbamoyltransferase complex dimerization subunit type 1 TsaB [Brevundimonas sp. Root1279]KQW86412.1 tRNA threonylcarbamoyladenosine biosynthesis protein TsaB [Brevundimonas sp. Root1279]